MSLAVAGLQASQLAAGRLRASWSSQPEARTANIVQFDPRVREFSSGMDGRTPGFDVVDLAGALVREAEQRTHQPEITIDVDGALSFDLRLTSGLLMFAELAIGGKLDITILNDTGQESFVVVVWRWEDQYVAESWRRWNYAHVQVEATSGPAQFTPEYRALLATNCRHSVPPD